MNESQKRSVETYRARLRQRGLARFEVQGLPADRALIRSLARRLAEDGPDAERLRATMRDRLSDEPPHTGGILAALRRSPLVGEDLEIDRSGNERDVDL